MEGVGRGPLDPPLIFNFTIATKRLKKYCLNGISILMNFLSHLSEW